MIRNNHSLEQLIDHNSIVNSSVLSSLVDQHETLEKQWKNSSYANEYSSSFEDAFDQLNIIYQSLLTKKSSFEKSSLRINEDEKFCSEIRYFSQHLILLFRALLHQSSDEFFITIQDNQFLDLHHRLEQSEDRITQFSKHFHHDEFNQLNSVKAELKDRLMEEKTRGKIAVRYANDWKENHLLQWIEMLVQFEQKSLQILQNYHRILHQSSLTHQQTMQILIDQGNDLKSHADHWYDHYHNSTSQFERELTDFRYELKQLRKHHDDLADEYERMKSIVDEYHRLKIEENLLLQKRKRQEQAIEQIQTWWRGTLIRRLKNKRKKRTTSLKSK